MSTDPDGRRDPRALRGKQPTPHEQNRKKRLINESVGPKFGDFAAEEKENLEKKREGKGRWCCRIEWKLMKSAVHT
jgi:hypothetical protein